MWIKAIDKSVWVSMKHITHFTIEQNPNLYGINQDARFRKIEKNSFTTYAYLDASQSGIYKRSRQNPPQEQIRLSVCQGSKEECEQFIVEKHLLEEAFQWLGYLVAGGVGAILTLIFQNAPP